MYFILISQKLDINIDITSDYNLNSINFKKQEIILAELKNVVEQNLPPSFNGDSAREFLNARAMVIGDSTAEGLTAYGVLNSSSVVWTRGRTIQNMTEDLNPVIQYNPNVLFIAYGANDLLSWNGNVNGYINAYTTVLDYLASVLPNTRICINSVLPVSSEAKEKNPAYNLEATSLLIKIAKKMGYTRWYGHIIDGNTKLIKMVEMLGYKYDGREVNDRWAGNRYYIDIDDFKI